MGKEKHVPTVPSANLPLSFIIAHLPFSHPGVDDNDAEINIYAPVKYELRYK